MNGWDVRVTEVQRTAEPLVWSAQGNATAPQGEWVIVHLTLANRSGESSVLTPSDFRLVRNDGTSFAASDDPNIVYQLPRYQSLAQLGEPFPVGVPLRTMVAFDVPTTARALRLRIRDMMPAILLQ